MSIKGRLAGQTLGSDKLQMAFSSSVGWILLYLRNLWPLLRQHANAEEDSEVACCFIVVENSLGSNQT